MDSRLDTVAKVIARGTTRRQVLRRIGGGLVGGTLAAVGLSAASVQAQDAGVCPVCRHCVDEFYSACVSSCAIQFPGNAGGCAQACCNGLTVTCSILGVCTPDCTITCPLSS
jgi:hypothetical protein